MQMEQHIFPDQMQREVRLSTFPPQRIISLVPSQTELLFHLGLDEEVVGITKFCIHPDVMFRSKPRVGGTKQLDFEKIDALNPDLIIANKEENEEQQIKALMEKYPVWISDISDLSGSLSMIRSVGNLVGKDNQAESLVAEIAGKFNKLQQAEVKKTVAYFIWQKPYMVVGSNTFIGDMLKRCGLRNVYGDHEQRYVEIDAASLQEANPDLILLSSEPFPFADKHIPAIKAICPRAEVLLADGELFSWYGSRLSQSPDYFRKLLNQ